MGINWRERRYEKKKTITTYYSGQVTVVENENGD